MIINSNKSSRIIAGVMSVLLLISCAACGTAYEPNSSEFKEKVELCNISAVNAVLMIDGEITWQGKYGQYSKIDSLYCIGSISKSFVAVLALILEQEGKISLDDKVNIYLPYLDLGNKTDVTLRDLLSMRSGIADYTSEFDAEDYFKEYSIYDLIDIGLSHSVFLKKENFSYSNTNILIAEQMIEKVTGENCEDLIKEKILIPLKLNHTYFAEDKQKMKDEIVPGYSNTKRKKQENFTDTTTSWADLACGMYSTAEDMAKWGDTLLNSSIISDESRRELFNFLPVNRTTDYGLCVIHKKIDDKDMIEIQGNVLGYSSAVYLYSDISVAVLCNLSDYSGSDRSYSEEIADLFLTKTINW